MSRRIKVINNELIEISDYRCSASLYPEVPPTLQNIKDQIVHSEDWCVFKETINPFVLYSNYYELQHRIDTSIKTLKNLKKSARWERHLYEVDYLIAILKGDEDGSNK